LDRRGERLAASICALKHALAIANMSSLPFLRGGIQLMLTIAESIEVRSSCLAQTSVFTPI
jgi:hypothetical protein